MLNNGLCGCASSPFSLVVVVFFLLLIFSCVSSTRGTVAPFLPLPPLLRGCVVNERAISQNYSRVYSASLEVKNESESGALPAFITHYHLHLQLFHTAAFYVYCFNRIFHRPSL